MFTQHRSIQPVDFAISMTRTVDNFMFRLRHKLEPDPRHPIYIRKAYGDGYRLIVD